MKRRIQEVIVVEGRHDTEKLKKYFDCETIETGGTSLDDEVMERIRRASVTRGVIVFTDPDSPGNRIRSAVNEAVPGCANAFVEKKKARTDKKVGVEHADYEALKAALDHLVTYCDNEDPKLTMQDMLELGLTGDKDSADLREKTGESLHIGNGNAKTMLNRMNFLGITRKQLEEEVRQWKN